MKALVSYAFWLDGYLQIQSKIVEMENITEAELARAGWKLHDSEGHPVDLSIIAVTVLHE